MRGGRKAPRARAPVSAARVGPVRDLSTPEELRACVALQEEVWGAGFTERVPSAILHATVRLGGVVAGARDEAGDLVGFVFGMTGIQDGEPVHWSDMLAVRPGLRDAGLGTLLKLHQRRVLLERGVRKVYWTFDPLESRNAYLNLAHLGVVAREYVPDMYAGSASPLHVGIGTDRFVALWLLDSPRVVRRVEGMPGVGAGEPATSAGAHEGSVMDTADAPQPAEPVLEAASSGELPRPGDPRTGLEAPWVSVVIPARIQQLKERDPGLARAWREATRTVLSHYLECGWEVRELERLGELSRYLLTSHTGDDEA